MVRPQAINLREDRDSVLRFHALGNYHSESRWAAGDDLEKYISQWLSTSQPRNFLSSVAESMSDARTIAELWMEDEQPVGFLWVTFYEIVGYSVTVAEVRDLEVIPEFHRTGIGTQMLARAETTALEIGADLLRSETGVSNIPMQRLFEKRGFEPFRLQYERLLTTPP